MQILSKYSYNTDKEDALTWFPNAKGEYYVKFAYKVFEKVNLSPWPPSVWSKIWKNRAWTKAQFFLWLVLHDKFLSLEQLYK